MEKRKRKKPLVLRYMQTFFATLSRLSPGLAVELAFRMFFRPRGRMKNLAGPDLNNSKFYIDVKGKRLTVNSWGRGPLVILVHGWEGSGLQWRKFVDRLVSAGYRTVTFDAPAHGESDGNTTNLLEFSAAIRAIQDLLGEPYAVIGHSLGGAATAIALDEGLTSKKIVTISAPAQLDFAIQQFSNTVNITDNVTRRMRDRISRHLNRSVDTMNFDAISSSLNIPGLIIHDSRDRIIPPVNSKLIHEAWPGSILETTSGLGHVRILEDDMVINKVLSFIGRKN